MRNVTFALLLVLSSAPAFSLDQDIIDVLAKLKPDFEKQLSVSSQSQQRLLLERYRDLLMRSRFGLDKNIDPDELSRYLFRQFEALPPGAEPEQKKGKKAPAYPAEMQSELSRIVKNLNGQIRDDLLQLTFTCAGERYEFGFEAQEWEGDFKLRLRGIPIPKESGVVAVGELSRCLEVHFTPADKVATLNWLDVRHVACAVPKNKAGECLLRAAEKIAAAAGKTQVLLIDSSMVQCPGNRKDYSLRRFKIYQEGKTWYEKQGYITNGNPSDVGDGKAQVQKYTLSKLLASAAELPVNERTTYSRALLDESAKKYLSLKNKDSVVDFMMWLWSTDCEVYGQIDEFITNRDWKLEFSKLFPVARAFHKKLGEDS